MQNAHQWVDLIMSNLFAPDNRRLGSIVTRLNIANSEIKKQQFFGFMHMGHRYLDPRYETQKKALARSMMPTLSFQLQEDVREFDRDRMRIEVDKSKIQQALAPLLINCNDLQDIRNSLPECLVSFVPQVSHLPRTRNDNLVHIRSDKFAVKAYEKALPLMEAYSVANLLF